jgi:PAS domain S-box-containing protein
VEEKDTVRMAAGAPAAPNSGEPISRRGVTTALIALSALMAAVWLGSRTLLSTNFLPHEFCYLRNARLLWTNVICDFLIGISYVVISATLFWIVRRAGRELPYPSFFWAFALFIVSCGLTHFMEVVTVWKPVYWLAAATKAVTAASSVGPAVFLVVLANNIVLIVRRAREASARRGEERFHAVIRSIPMALITFDLQGCITSWNLAAEETFGWKADEVIGKPSPVVPRELEQEHNDLLRNAIAGKVSPGIETTRVDREGRAVAARLSTAPIYDEEGKLTGVMRVVEDISEQKRIAKAVERDEARLSSIIDTAMDAVITVGEQQHITLFNPAAERMFGCTASDALGQPLDRFIPRRFRGAHGEHVRRFGSTDVTRRKMGELGSIYGLRANGEEFSIEASISHSQVGGEKLFTVILRDITERKRAEEELRQSASLLDLTPVLVRDMDNRIVLWTRGAEAIYGYSKTEAMGRMSHELLKTEFPMLLEKIEQMLMEEGSWEGELLHLTRNANRVYVASKWVLYYDDRGKPFRILEVNADITDRKRAESMQLRSQKLESLGTLAGGIAHDFNNVLLAINGNTKLAIADLPADHPVQLSLSEIAKAGARAADLVQRILGFSRPQEQKREIYQLQPIVEEGLKLVRATLPALIEIQTNFRPGLPPVSVDSTQIHQVIVNLATNAAHAIGDRPGVIEVRLDAVELDDRDTNRAPGLHPGRYVRLYVGDTGCGMTRETLDRIFDPFFTTKPVGQGTGLGLSVVHGIVRGHDGAITVYSQPGQGTAFHLYFPASQQAAVMAPQVGETVRPVAGTGYKGHILYVDDEEGLVLLSTRMLERLGYNVTGFVDAQEAIREFTRQPSAFDAVVTDLAMPRLSGFDLARELLRLRPDVPVIMTSGYVRPEEQETAKQIGIRAVLLKPSTINELERVLGEVFQEQQVPGENSH